MTTALRPLSVGEILDGAFTLYRGHFLVLYATQLAVLWPAAALFFLEPDISALVQILVFFLIAMNAAIWQMSEAVQGRPPRLFAAVRVGLRRYFPVLFATFVAAVLYIVGFLLLVVPFVILWIVFFAVTPVIVVEGRFVHSFRRSVELARKSWRKIFLIYLVSSLIVGLPGLTFESATGENRNPFIPEPAGPLVLTFQLLMQALTIPFSAGVLVLLYYDQRVRKEGLDVELAAAALDGLPSAPPAPGLAVAGAPAGSGEAA